MDNNTTPYASPKASLKEEEWASALLSPQAWADFRAAAKWMKRGIRIMLAVASLRVGFMLFTTWQWTSVSWGMAIIKFAGIVFVLASIFVALPPLRRCVRSAETTGDADEAVLQALRYQRKFWKRLILFYLIVFCAMVIFMLAGFGLLR